MATMLFDRIVPSGNDAYFPFQMSAASLSPSAVVYIANTDSGADSTVSSGVSVDDMGNGLYALKVTAANMTADAVYYAIVTAGSEVVRIPLWAYAPSAHIAEVLADLATVDGVVDGIASEIGDVSTAFTGAADSPTTVAEGLRAIYDNLGGSGDPWATDISGASSGTAGHTLQTVYNEITDASTGMSATAGRVMSIETDVTALGSTIGTPAGASVSADIAAVKAVVDTLQGAVNARLVPSVPSEITSAPTAFRVRLGLIVQDGQTGMPEDPDVVGTNGHASGQALIQVTTIGSGSNPTLHDAQTDGNALGTTDASGFEDWTKMKRVSQGQFEAWVNIAANFNRGLDIQFLVFDSDPGSQQMFTSSRFMVVRSPAAAGGGGAF